MIGKGIVQGASALMILSMLLSFDSKGTAASFAQQYAVSLKVLQERLKLCTKQGACSEQLLTLCSLTKIDGYIIDQENNDLILFGKSDNEAPSLRTEDFAIALRNIWMKYAVVEGHTYIYSHPGCSIDPNPETMSELNYLNQSILNNMSIQFKEAALKTWCKICEQKQQVRVLGIPFNTHFAKVMVDADYYMKRLANGSEKLDVFRFENLIDLTLSEIKKNVVNKEPISLPALSWNRFEFYPGDNIYLEDEKADVVCIEKCPIHLLTEQEYFSQSGLIQGMGSTDPLAKKFAESFTSHYAEIAQKKTIYQELEGLFRFVALAKIMKQEKVTFNFDYLLNEFPVPRVTVNSSVPGLSFVREFQHQIDYSTRFEIVRLWIPSCGGVGINVKVNPNNFIKDKTKGLVVLRRSILNARPSPFALFWSFSKERG